MAKEPTPAEAARIAAGYDLETAAKKLNRCPRYVRRLELRGGATLSYARKAGRLFQCDGNLFLHSPEYWKAREAMLSTSLPPVSKPHRPKRSREVLRRI